MMRLTIERLRGVILLGGSALVLLLLGVLGWAHFRAHERLRDLPARLGADVQRDADGITYSQTLAGRVAFTLHAKHATQRRSGEAMLEDAGLVLYGEGNGRADRIYGKNFVWDQKGGVVTAIGPVQLDLQAPAPTTAAERIGFASGGARPNRTAMHGGTEEPVHATTSGLRYVQGTGMATTAEHVTFNYKGMNGESEGASYASRDGVLVLDHAVRLEGELSGRAFTVKAAHAVMHRTEDQLLLTDALVTLAAKGTQGPEEVQAARMTLQMAAEGGVERADGAGGVELRNPEEMAKGPTAVLRFRPGNVPDDLVMRGGVEFARAAVGGGGPMTGAARESESRFNAQGKVESERLDGGVVVTTEGAGKSRRRLTAEHVALALGSKGELQRATATGGATMVALRPGGVEDSLAADQVQAEFGGERAELKQVTGEGAAVLRRVAPGLEETSRAPRVVAEFAPSAAGGGRGGAGVEISEVTESGGVVIDREQRRAGVAEAERTHATARDSTYDARSRRGVLTGDAVVTEPDRTLRADRVVLLEETGDAEAEGAVQASFVPQNAGAAGRAKGGEVELVHAVGARATARRSDGSVTVYGDAGGRDARMWQGASQVEAPELVLRNREGTLDAFGTGDGGGMVVRTVLAGAGGVAGAGGGAQKTGAGATGGSETEAGPGAKANGTVEVVRVLSGRLHFVNGTATTPAEGGRRAEFTEGVRMESRDGQVRAQRAVATLRSGGAGAGSAGGTQGGLGMGGGVEKVVARGAVSLEQPGRTASGTELVWTAADGMYVLTGTPASPPEVTDAARGRVSGGEIQFHAGDSSVVVTGAAPGGRGGRVQTETRLKAKE